MRQLPFRLEYWRIKRFLYRKIKNRIKKQYIFLITIPLRKECSVDVQRTTCGDYVKIFNKEKKVLISFIDYKYVSEGSLPSKYYIMNLTLKEVKELF